MADTEAERTEEATPKRRDEARKAGNVTAESQSRWSGNACPMIREPRTQLSSGVNRCSPVRSTSGSPAP